MNIEITDKGYGKSKSDGAVRITITDSQGNTYRIKEDVTGGIEVMAEDGILSIEPNSSNLVYLKTVK